MLKSICDDPDPDHDTSSSCTPTQSLHISLNVLGHFFLFAIKIFSIHKTFYYFKLVEMLTN